MLICYSTDSPESLRNVQEMWVDEIKHYCPKTPILLIATKSDLKNEKSAIRYVVCVCACGWQLVSSHWLRVDYSLVWVSIVRYINRCKKMQSRRGQESGRINSSTRSDRVFGPAQWACVWRFQPRCLNCTWRATKEQGELSVYCIIIEAINSRLTFTQPHTHTIIPVQRVLYPWLN